MKFHRRMKLKPEPFYLISISSGLIDSSLADRALFGKSFTEPVMTFIST